MPATHTDVRLPLAILVGGYVAALVTEAQRDRRVARREERARGGPGGRSAPPPHQARERVWDGEQRFTLGVGAPVLGRVGAVGLASRERGERTPSVAAEDTSAR